MVHELLASFGVDNKAGSQSEGGVGCLPAQPMLPIHVPSPGFAFAVALQPRFNSIYDLSSTKALRSRSRPDLSALHLPSVHPGLLVQTDASQFCAEQQHEPRLLLGSFQACVWRSA